MRRKGLVLLDHLGVMRTHGQGGRPGSWLQPNHNARIVLVLADIGVVRQDQCNAAHHGGCVHLARREREPNRSAEGASKKDKPLPDRNDRLAASGPENTTSGPGRLPGSVSR